MSSHPPISTSTPDQDPNSHAHRTHTHTLPPATPLSHQVGGHAGVHVTEDESLLLKPALPREIAFYQFVRDVDVADARGTAGVQALRDWIPSFFGLLSLEGRLADPSVVVDPVAMMSGTVPGIVPVSMSEDTSSSSSVTPGQMLVLQNLLCGYRKPCVLDVKLGTVLYDEDASKEKKARMIRKAANSTSLETGIRLTGFQVYSNHAPDPIVYGRAYGYSLTPDQLPDGLRHFFPCAIASTLNADLDPSTSSPSNAGLPADLLVTLLTSLHDSISNLRTSLSGAHVRIVGGSVLIIYEGDWERAAVAAASGRGGGPNSPDETESEDEEGDEGSDMVEIQVDERGGIVVESLPRGSSETSSSSSSSTDAQPRLYTVSLIDFAHTRVVPGEGPDEGVLKGLDTLLRLVDQRRQEVATLLEP